jgi:hypothetical protein
MVRTRIASLALILLGLALAGAPGAIGQARLGAQAAPDATGPFVARQGGVASWRSPKAAELPFDPLGEVVTKTDFVVGTGTGGGDVAESEPNDTIDVADEAADLPFNCTGAIEAAADIDVIAVHVTAGQAIEVNVFSRLLPGGIDSPLDPYLAVGYRDHPVAFNDDVAPGNVNSRVAFVAPTTDTLYIVVQRAGMAFGDNCRYVVSALPVTTSIYDPANVETEPNDGPYEADELAPPGVKIGLLAADGGYDWTYFDAPAGATAVVDVSASVLGYPTDPFVAFFGPGPAWLFDVFDHDGLDPRMNILLPETGRYWVVVGAPATASSTSFYMLSVTLQDGAGSPVLSQLKLTSHKKLKKVIGGGFDPTGMKVEVDARPVPSVPSATSPTTVLKVKPRVTLESQDVVTVVRPNGRRSNPITFE